MALQKQKLFPLILWVSTLVMAMPALGADEAGESAAPETPVTSNASEDNRNAGATGSEVSTTTPPEGAPSRFSPGQFDDEGNWIPEENALTGAEIYQRVLDNRFNSYEQKLLMESGDRGGNTSDVEMEVKYMSLRETSKTALSNTIAKYHAPMDVRHMGYLVINKAKGTDDQFVYLPSYRRVRRINLRGESIVGTDFNLEDIVPREFEDAAYTRLPDEKLQGIECYTVEVVPTEESDSEYSKFIAYVDKKTFVPIENVYWDRRGVKIKRLSVEPDSITRFEDIDKAGPRIVWVALHSRVENVKLNTYTKLDIQKIKANPGLGKRHFSQRQLTAGR